MAGERIKEASLKIPTIDIINSEGTAQLLSLQIKLTGDIQQFLVDIERTGYQVTQKRIVGDVYRVNVSKHREITVSSFAVDGDRAEALTELRFRTVDAWLVPVIDFSLGGQYGKANGRTVVLNHRKKVIFLSNLDRERIAKAKGLEELTSGLAGTVVMKEDTIPTLLLRDHMGREILYFPGEFNALATLDGVNIDEVGGRLIKYEKKPYFAGNVDLQFASM
ncbi:hypothetical protein HYT59_00190 [Candidatus Woesebacteria bacterium]|nr:hypothetical protein [Candidatus Woesebacteria bacterium]